MDHHTKDAIAEAVLIDENELYVGSTRTLSSQLFILGGFSESEAIQLIRTLGNKLDDYVLELPKLRRGALKELRRDFENLACQTRVQLVETKSGLSLIERSVLKQLWKVGYAPHRIKDMRQTPNYVWPWASPFGIVRSCLAHLPCRGLSS